MSQQSSEINRLKSQFKDLLRERKKYQDPLAESIRHHFGYTPQGKAAYLIQQPSSVLNQEEEWRCKLQSVEGEMAEVIRKLHELGSEIDGWSI
jgi:hypothetical protein